MGYLDDMKWKKGILKQIYDEQDAIQEGLRLQRLQIKLTVLFGIIASLPFLLPQINIFGKLLNKLSLKIEIPKLTIQLLIALISIVILTLIFSLKCIFKKEKTIVIGAKPPKDFTPLPEIQDLPNKKEMHKLLPAINKTVDF